MVMMKTAVVVVMMMMMILGKLFQVAGTTIFLLMLLLLMVVMMVSGRVFQVVSPTVFSADIVTVDGGNGGFRSSVPSCQYINLSVDVAADGKGLHHHPWSHDANVHCASDCLFLPLCHRQRNPLHLGGHGECLALTLSQVNF